MTLANKSVSTVLAITCNRDEKKGKRSRLARKLVCGDAQWHGRDSAEYLWEVVTGRGIISSPNNPNTYPHSLG